MTRMLFEDVKPGEYFHTVIGTFLKIEPIEGVNGIYLAVNINTGCAVYFAPSISVIRITKEEALRNDCD